MEYEELRIGNYIETQDGVTGIVTGMSFRDNLYLRKPIIQFTKTSKTLSLDIVTVSLENFKSIPLSGDWLEILGFKNKFNFSWEKDNITILYYGDEKVYCASQIGEYKIRGDNTDRITITTVHQLQNLVYELTKQKLEIEVWGVNGI